MPGFIRRFAQFPPVEVITEIEGVVIVSLTPVGGVEGLGTGTVALVGEFADMTFATAVSALGVVTSDSRPVEVFSGEDMKDKLGGFDETIGEFGSAMGSGFVELRNKRYSRLILVPINLSSTQGARYFRQLPTSAGAADPLPVVPVVAAAVEAGREFKNAANRVKSGVKVIFDDEPEFLTGIDGSVTIGVPAATRPFDSAGSDFNTVVRPDGTLGVKEGDIVVVGQIGGAAGLGANAATYRVNAVALATQLDLELMDGTDFDWVTTAALPFRIHIGETADSNALNAADAQAGYTVPSRPLDATILVDLVLTPSVVPPAPTQTSWDALSGLGGRTDPVTGLVHVALVQAPNAANDALIDALYDAAVDSLEGEEDPQRDVTIAWSARKSDQIRVKLKSHVLLSSGEGRSRIALTSPELDTLSFNTVIGDAAPGVGANRNQRVIYDWPGLKTFVPEAVGFPLDGADGSKVTDGLMDTTSDGWMASILSQLAPERNPGQARDPVATVMSPAQGIQRGVTGLKISNYKTMRRKGIAGPRVSRRVGAIFQSGITSSLISGEKNINRIRFAGFIEDSLAEALVIFSKDLLTPSLEDDVVVLHEEFFGTLLSEDNPAAARIADFKVDAKGGNTEALRKKGIFVVQSQVEMLITADFIVGQIEVGLGVLNVTFS